ncbi:MULTISPECIES: SRPBCC family protein [unclassified Gordonia (in: high G+C Gram-positive bacteria)]
MAVTAKTEFDIAAPPAVVMEVLMDIESLPDWSGPHKAAKIVSTHDDGTPDEALLTVNALGINDEQTVNYTWTENTCEWTLSKATTLSEQDGKYTITPDGDGSHVEFELVIDLKIKLPGLIVKRGQKIAIDTARKGLTAEAERRAKG